MATIEYDKNTFEQIKTDNIKLLNGWTGLSYNEENGMILINKMEKLAETEDLFEIHFTVKQDIKDTNTQIKVSDAQSADENVPLNASDAQLDISVKKGSFSFSNKIVILIIIFIIGEIIGYFIVKMKKRKNTKGEN